MEPSKPGDNAKKGLGCKYDAEKPAMGLIPPFAELEMAKAFGYGAKKYGQWNFLNGIEYTRIVGALRRHMNAYMRGEDNDSESGLLHLAHVAACVAMLIEMHYLHPDLDDRYRGYRTNEKSNT